MVWQTKTEKQQQQQRQQQSKRFEIAHNGYAQSNHIESRDKRLFLNTPSSSYRIYQRKHTKKEANEWASDDRIAKTSAIRDDNLCMFKYCGILVQKVFTLSFHMKHIIKYVFFPLFSSKQQPKRKPCMKNQIENATRARERVRTWQTHSVSQSDRQCVCK